jgi:hypothetical protein
VSRLALDPAMPVLLRPDGAVQVGGSPPRRAGAAARWAVPDRAGRVLRTMRVPVGIAQLRRLAGGHGLVTPLPSMNC